jgi:hypothetical protein
MQILTTERATPEFYRAHRKRISAGDVPAAIARRGTKKRDALIDRLAIDFEGIENHTDDYPDPWTIRHESVLDAAVTHYATITGDVLEFVGFVVSDSISWLGASPHALTPTACIHIRERTTLRSYKEKRGHISGAELARFQTTMFVCDRPTCDVIDFWFGGDDAPNRISRHRLEFNYSWFSENVLSRLTFVWRDVAARIKSRDTIRCAGSAS